MQAICSTVHSTWESCHFHYPTREAKKLNPHFWLLARKLPKLGNFLFCRHVFKFFNSFLTALPFTEAPLHRKFRKCTSVTKHYATYCVTLSSTKCNSKQLAANYVIVTAVTVSGRDCTNLSTVRNAMLLVALFTPWLACCCRGHKNHAAAYSGRVRS